MKIDSNPKQKKNPSNTIKTATNKQNQTKKGDETKKNRQKTTVTIFRLNSSRCFLTREGKKNYLNSINGTIFFCEAQRII